MKHNLKTLTAYHEAGHAVAFILTDRKFKIVTIKNNGGTLGHVLHHKLNHSFLYNLNIDKLYNECFRSFAGTISEQIYSGKKNHISAGSDYHFIADIVLSVLGGDSKITRSFLKFIRLYTYAVLKNELNWVFVEAVAKKLIEQETLSYDEVFKTRMEGWK